MKLCKAEQSVPRFQIIKQLPAGLSGKIYHAIDRRTGEQVALKLLYNSEAQVRLHFLNEQKLLSLAQPSYSHPHIVRLVSSNADAEPYYIATAYIDAYRHRTLARLRSSALALRVAEQTASALDYFHTRHPYAPVIHRDVKPANILIARRSGQATLIDLSIASHPYFALVAARPCGTAQYMAPEQYLGEETPVSDQFSLALVCYYYLAGEPLLQHQGLAGVRQTSYRRISRGVAPGAGTLSQWRERVRSELHMYHVKLRRRLAQNPRAAEVLLQALAFDTGQRFSSCTAFAERLRAALAADGAPTRGPRLPAVREPCPWFASLLGGGAVLSAAAVLALAPAAGSASPPLALPDSPAARLALAPTVTLPPRDEPTTSTRLVVSPASAGAKRTRPGPTATPAAALMPNLIGYGENQARAILAARDIDAARITVDYQSATKLGPLFERYPAYAVVSTQPQPDTPLDADSMVVLGIRSPHDDRLTATPSPTTSAGHVGGDAALGKGRCTHTASKPAEHSCPRPPGSALATRTAAAGQEGERTRAPAVAR